MKTIALISGGLDSIVAAKLIQEQGVEVFYLNLKIPFCHKDRKGENKIARNYNIDLKTIDLSEEFLEIIRNPKHGYGSNMNPCIDCKILMLRKAKDLLQEWGAQFIVTGEVLGQRPMSQHKRAMKLIEIDSGLEGLILRPLSAKLLDETIPEKLGWVDRNKLMDFGGRTRRPQMELAKKLGVESYPNAAGGCLLTDPEFSKRLKELIEQDELNLANVELLKIGRHFRLRPKIKLAVGRNEKENMELEKLAGENDLLFFPPQDLAGPTGLGRGEFSEELIQLSARIICRYCDLNDKIETDIIYRKIGVVPRVESSSLRASPIIESQLLSLRI